MAGQDQANEAYLPAKGVVAILQKDGHAHIRGNIENLRVAGIPCSEVTYEGARAAEIQGITAFRLLLRSGGTISLRDITFQHSSGTLSHEGQSITEALDVLGIKYQRQGADRDKSITITDPASIKAVACHGGKFTGSSKYLGDPTVAK
jgi:hypothetical protein